MKSSFLFFATWGLVGISILASGTRPAQQEKPDLKKMRAEIEVLESVLRESLRQAVPTPFGFPGDAQGVYLPGYGVVFSFEINLTATNSLGPFGAQPTAEQERTAREEEGRRVQRSKEMAEKVLADFANTLTDLPPSDSVAIVIHTVAAHANGIERSTIVMRASKQLVDEYRANKIDRTTFLRRVSTIEY